MPQDYSLSDAQKMLGTDNKMLQKWIAEAVQAGEPVRPRTDPRNQSRKVLTRAQVERLAQLHGRTLPPDTSKPADPLAALEQRLLSAIRKLEQRIAVLEAGRAEHAPVTHSAPRQTVSSAPVVQQHASPKPEPAERVHFATFLRWHFAEEDKMAAYQVADSILSAIQRHQSISTSNRVKLISAWRDLPGFAVCGRAGCPCGD